MSKSTDEHTYFFESPAGNSAVNLPYDLDALLADFAALRSHMVRRISPDFTREEWAYLVGFLWSGKPARRLHPSLRRAVRQSVESRDDAGAAPRPRRALAAQQRQPLGTADPALAPAQRQPDPRQGRLALGGSRRLLPRLCPRACRSRRAHRAPRPRRHARGLRPRRSAQPRDGRRVQDARRLRLQHAAEAVHALPHPLDSVGVSFSDRRSEVWVEPRALTDETLTALIKVFAIYGQAGCTSPGRVVVLDAPRSAATALRDRMLALWPRVLSRDVAPHLASQNVMARQWAAALGWDATLASHNHAVLAVGDYALPPVPSPLLLPIVAAPLEEAVAHLPPNIQTLGQGVVEPDDARWLRVLADQDQALRADRAHAPLRRPLGRRTVLERSLRAGSSGSMTMIREHAFNSAWWGDKAGFVESALFTLPDAERDAFLRDYAWVEYVAPIDTVAPAALLRAGFMQTDVQIVFRLDLRRLFPLPDFANLSIASAAEEPFHIGDDELGEFEHERFRYLPGITPAKLKDRYTRWANALIDANPEWSLRIAHVGKVQGWFLSELDGKGFHLTLAALHRGRHGLRAAALPTGARHLCPARPARRRRALQRRQSAGPQHLRPPRRALPIAVWLLALAPPIHPTLQRLSHVERLRTHVSESTATDRKNPPQAAGLQPKR